MLQEIKDLQNEAVSKLVLEVKNKKETFFKAPTGSGKTFMMADFMNRELAQNNDIIFLVSSLSKGDLAKQNYEKFCDYSSRKFFANLNPYLINSEIANEERLVIPTNHNVYLLPRDLYKKGGRLMQGGMLDFLEYLVWNGKTIILIKDECHVATNNLDNISAFCFYKTVNFSATPKLSRGQYPDVEIKNEDAENVKLIKTIEWGSEDDNVSDAVEKFVGMKENYINLLGVNPCLIIQISNKDKADEELQNNIMPVLNAKPDLKWMLIVNDKKECNTNDVFKAKKMDIDKWKYYAKQNMSPIDVIIFKMVISEGWDIPRACMLYQVRDTKSKQLDEQVVGRVRRNPRLLDFEKLSDKAQQLAMTAWVWGIKMDNLKKHYGVKLYEEPKNITDNIKVKTTQLKHLPENSDFDISTFLSKQQKLITHKNIFEIARQIRQTDYKIIDKVYEYATDFSKWWEIAEFVPELEKENKQHLSNYEQSMEVKEEVSFALYSHYTDNGFYENIGNWIWKRRDGADKFAFDSKAEQEWASILKDLSNMDNNAIPSQKSISKIKIGKRNKTTAKFTGQENIYGEIETGKIEEKEIFLWGKNYPPNSPIKFEYYLGGEKLSFPDFIMKDAFGRVHIFEVKSVNQSDAYVFDSNLYNAKIIELKKCYKQASLITEQFFYFPIQNKNIWQITCFYKGEENTLSIEQFISFIKNK